jgi:hypothetical protein
MRKIITMAVVCILYTVKAQSQTPQWDAGTSPNRLVVNPISTQVGIGTTAPSASLDIEFDVGSVGIDINHTGANPVPRILFQLRDSSRFAVGVDGTDAKKFKISTTAIDMSSYQTRFMIDSLGKVGVGDSTPVSLFTVAEGDKFQVDNNGDMVKIKNITYSWPTTQGASNTFLKNDGSGNLSWSNGNSDYWKLTGNSGTTAGTNFIGTTDAVDWVIKTNNTERMRVLSGGNIGIGTSSPNSKLHVAGNAEISANNFLKLNGFNSTSNVVVDLGSYDIYADNTGSGSAGNRVWWNAPDQGDFIIGPRAGSSFLQMFRVRADSMSFETTTAQRTLVLTSNGNVGVNTSSPAALLHVAGDMKINTIPAGGMGDSDLGFDTNNKLVDLSSSSKYFKTNIKDLNFDKNSFLSLRPVSYNWKPFYGGVPDVGFIAQEVASVFPDLAIQKFKATYLSNGDILRDSLGLPVVDSSQTEPYGVKYHKLPVYLFMLAKQQDSVIASLIKKVDSLGSKLDECCSAPRQNRKGSADDNNMEGSYDKGKTETRYVPQQEYVLLQNDPNPFADYTDINFSISPNAKSAVLIVVDITGRIVKNIDVGSIDRQNVRIYSSDIGNGLFSYYLLENGNIVAGGKMVSSK